MFQSCTVTDVYDGDTLTAFCVDRSMRVRISSIDAPDMVQQWGDRHVTSLASLFKGKPLNFTRLIAISTVVWLRRLTLAYGRDFARVMVGQGFAFHYVRYSMDPELLTIEAEAKAANRGIWSFGGSQRPDEFRAKQRMRPTKRRR